MAKAKDNSIFDLDDYEEIPRDNYFKCKGNECVYFCFDCLDNKKRDDIGEFCGLHGMSQVKPGTSVNLDHRGGCGFVSKIKQLTLF